MKNFIGLMIAFMITGVLSAQNINAPKGHVNIGIKGGVNIYNLYNDNGVKFDSKLGFNLGLLGHIHIAKNFAIQPEIQYSAQGAKSTVANVETKLIMNYINVPVLIQYMWDNGFRLQAGPQVGLLMSAKTKVNSTTVDVKNGYKTADFGVSFGGGYIHPATGIGIDARYNLGLSNIIKSDTFKRTNRGIQVSLFYIFGHNTKKG
jgi:hypothetical protein